MTNLINFSINCDFASLESRIKQIYGIEDYQDRLNKTVELLEEISESASTDSLVYSAGLSDQLAVLGDTMAVYVMAKVWEVHIYGLKDIQSKESVLIDTLDEYGISFYRHPIDANKVKWLVEYEANRP